MARRITPEVLIAQGFRGRPFHWPCHRLLPLLLPMLSALAVPNVWHLGALVLVARLPARPPHAGPHSLDEARIKDAVYVTQAPARRRQSTGPIVRLS
jgi:hypothetical protein